MTSLLFGIMMMALGGYSIGGLKGMMISVGLVFALIFWIICML